MKFWYLVVLTLAVGAGSLLAQSTTAFGNPTNSLQLQIRLTNAGDLVNLAKVELFKGDMPMPTAYANSRGEVDWINLPNGSYSVRVMLPGYLPGEASIELMGGGARQIFVMLEPDPNAVRDTTVIPDDPLVSVRYLAAPEKARKELERARQARRRGDCKSAIKYGKKAIEIAPTFAVAHVETGMCELTQGKLKDAEESFNAAIKADPEFLYGYIGLSNVEVKKQQWNEAAKILGLANKAQPNRAEPFYELARIQLQTGHLDKAELAAKTALTKDYTRIPDLPFLLARVYVMEGKNEEAVKCLRQIVDLNPGSAIGDRAQKSIEMLRNSEVKTNKP
ncbi:MAG: tetratricopeptide repeat protein [Terriglobia bacterium]|jgi:Tfp pilus assembly protein PilF|nr:tetratricopeptide repeat protein [Terriglobia bacterium]